MYATKLHHSNNMGHEVKVSAPHAGDESDDSAYQKVIKLLHCSALVVVSKASSLSANWWYPTTVKVAFWKA